MYYTLLLMTNHIYLQIETIDHLSLCRLSKSSNGDGLIGAGDCFMELVASYFTPSPNTH